ncbi:leucine-rich repeat transmembrane protein FLRT3 isoform X2 [Harpegnathos saltator]|uniref:Immunoglobulin superfamily member 10 n=1 Tax=Harpegnathos saltator TaxID=610380 RepID=E2C614_HARSA|nr:leucine-rich repeat transmembrane protein FLRT3 isoform X2 [Harpegnathos saltator]EFN76619.1 Immunoglobulin superfamily member 10 [Harpegnathos saltator]
MTRQVLETLLVALVLDALANGASTRFAVAGSCPSFCACDTWYELQRVSCTGRHLYSIHTGAPSDVQAMDVSNNTISELNDYELTNIGLSKLKYFNLSANAISDISLRAFDGLLELAVLDLSQNRLHYLHAETFVPTASLRILQLSRNDFNSHVPKLRSPSLMNLAMDSCQISYIPADTFAGLSHLRSLDLSNNLMIQLDSITLQPLKLRQLAITGNPWSCNKLMHDLELYLTGKNIEHDTVCGKNTGPKKFEKMIVYDPHVKYEKHRPSIIANVNTKNALTPRKDLTPVPTIKDASICGNATAESDLTKTLNAISPYWFFVFGFLLGSACATFTTYIWLTKRIICCRRYRERRNNDIQRVSLLQNLWQFDDPAFNDNETRHETRSCPGTPPPPYREVMSRPGLYRSPSVNTNNSAART